MLLAKFPLDGRGALYEQLARALKRAIVEGHFHPGERLPATRALAQMLNVSRNTVLTAYEILRAEQLTISNERSGTRIAELSLPPGFTSPPVAAPPQSRYAGRLRKLGPQTLGRIREELRYNLHSDNPPFTSEMLRSWSRKLAAAARVAGAHYPDSQGFQPLRAAIADYLARRRGVVCAESDVLIVGGTQQAVTIAARAVLDEGDTVAIEDPHYLYLMQSLTAHGSRILSVRTDENGMVTSELARHKARLICVSPSDQFPSGVVMSLERRIELLDIASRQGSWILEDDYNSEFYFRDRPIAALRSLDFSGRVIYVGTFSKTLFPSLRLGYIVCPPGIREDLCRVKRFDDLGSPSVEQAALAAFMRSRQFEKYLRRAVVALRHCRTVFIDSMRRHCGERITIQDTHAGTHVVVWLRNVEYSQVTRLVEIGIGRGLGLYPIHPYYRNPPERPGLMLGYAGLSAEALTRAGELLGECLSELEGEGRGKRAARAGPLAVSGRN
jgi:GntR family transcriptional regulator / MocR family aminotransferase